MDYRMYDKGAPAGKNVVKLIAQHLHEQGQVKTGKLILDFVGFEGAAGTTFTLNNQEDKIMIPNCGHFITPHCGDRYMKIHSLVFDNDFTGNIYYII